MKAVVFVDVQKDFIDGALRNEKAIEVTPKIVEFAKQCAADPDCKLYATRDTHEKTEYIDNNYTHTLKVELDKRGPEYRRDSLTEDGKMIIGGYLASLEGKRLPVEHCIELTDGWMIDNRLMEVLDGKCTFINKPTFGSFDLAEIIYEDDIVAINKHNYLQGALHCHKKTLLDEIVLCGFCTDICCISCGLLLRAKFPNTKITVMKDLCAGTTKENHEAALKVMQSCQIDIA